MRCPNSTEPTARTTAPKGDVPPGRRVVGVRSASAPRPGHRGSRGHSRAGTGDRHTHRERIHARTGYRWAPRPTCDRHTTAVQCAGPLRWFASPDRTAGDGVQPTPWPAHRAAAPSRCQRARSDTTPTAPIVFGVHVGRYATTRSGPLTVDGSAPTQCCATAAVDHVFHRKDRRRRLGRCRQLAIRPPLRKGQGHDWRLHRSGLG